MAILRNKTQGDFTIIQNNILRDRRTSIKCRGLFLTLCGLPDNWSFSEEGLTKTMKDGKDSVHSALKELEELGYLKRYTRKDNLGRFESIIEVFPEGNAPKNPDDKKKAKDDSESELLHAGEDVEQEIVNSKESGFTVTENPSRAVRGGKTVTEKQQQYNTLNTKNKLMNNIKECVSVKHTLGNQSLTTDDYEDLVRQYGKEAVDYQINRILSKPYNGCLRKDIIARWVSESLSGSSRKVSGGCYPIPPANSGMGGIKQQYDFDALNRFIRDN